MGEMRNKKILVGKSERKRPIRQTYVQIAQYLNGP
jgi:hypothetical protein